VGVNEPVASGIVAMVDRPTGNIISFSNYEASLETKWFELLCSARMWCAPAANGFAGTGLC
jgi:hypothetical protein